MGAYAPSQNANPNITRFFTYQCLPDIVRCLEATLDQLHFEHVPDVNVKGHTIRFAGRDARSQRLSGKLSIDYEATDGDYMAAASDASQRDLAKMRKGALTADQEKEEGEDDDMTVQPGMQMQMPVSTAPKKGRGQGGYVVSISGKGDPLERKRLFRQIEKLLPAGLVFAR